MPLALPLLLQRHLYLFALLDFQFSYIENVETWKIFNWWPMVRLNQRQLVSSSRAPALASPLVALSVSLEGLLPVSCLEDDLFVIYLLRTRERSLLCSHPGQRMCPKDSGDSKEGEKLLEQFTLSFYFHLETDSIGCTWLIGSI